MAFSRKKIFSREDSYGVVALILYIMITVLIFFPLVANFRNSTLIPSFGVTSALQGGRDKYHFMWNFWWMRTAILSGQNMLYTHNLFAPYGVSLALQTMDYIDGFISWPFSLILGGNIAGFNFIILLGIVLSGYTAFLLARHLTKSWIASFGAGLIYAYFPQHISQAIFGHPNLSSIEWLPAYLLALMIAFERRKMAFAVVAGIFLTLSTLTDLQLLVISLVITLVYLIYHLVITKFSSPVKVLYLIMTVFAVWFLTSAPYLVPAYEALGVVHPPPPLSTTLGNSAKPMYYIIPPPSYLVYGTIFSQVYSSQSPFLQPILGGHSQWMIFVGYTTLALAAIGALISKDRRRIFFVGLAFGAYLLSLGPSADPSQLSIQTPYDLLYYHFKIVEYFRADARFSILLMLCLAMLAAYGIDAISKLTSVFGTSLNVRRTKIVGIILLILILLEFIPIINVQSYHEDPVYSIIAKDPTQFSVLELPSSLTQTQLAIYAQTFYGKPLVNGKISQARNTLPDYMYVQLYLRILSRPNKASLGRLKLNQISEPVSEFQLAPIVLSYYHIKYIIVHYKAMTKVSFEILYEALSRGLGPPVYRDRNVLLFELKNWVSPSAITEIAQKGPIVLFGSSKWSPERARQWTMNNTADLIVYAATPALYTVTLGSTSPFCVDNLNWTAQGTMCGNYDPSSLVGSDQIFLGSGENVLSISLLGSPSSQISSIQVAPS